jgi:hypothetical protein
MTISVYSRISVTLKNRNMLSMFNLDQDAYRLSFLGYPIYSHYSADDEEHHEQPISELSNR